jgi:hypothetical protein
MPWEQPEVQQSLKKGLNLGKAKSIQKIPNSGGGILDTVHNLYKANTPESVQNGINKLLMLGQILGLNDPATAYGGPMRAGAGIIGKSEEIGGSFKTSVEKLSDWLFDNKPPTSELLSPRPGSPASNWKKQRKLLSELIDSMTMENNTLTDSNGTKYAYSSEAGMERLTRIK